MQRRDLREAEGTVSEVAQRVGRAATGRVRTFASLGNPTFRLYFVGMLSQVASMNMQQVTTPLLVYRITGSAALLGVVAMSGSLPHIFFSLFGGVVADRMQKKHILLIALGSFTFVSLGIATALATGLLNEKTWWILIINSVVQSSLLGLMIPARHSIIREIVGRERLMNAIALNSLGGNSLRLVAPAAAGFFIDAFGFKTVYFIMAAVYATGFLVITLLPLTSKILPTTRNPFQSVTDGFKYISREKVLLLVLIFTLLSVMLSMPYQQLMAVFVDDVFKVGAKGMGVLMSVSGLGSIAGGLVLASLTDKKRGLIMLMGTLFLGMALTLFSVSQSWTLAMAAMVAVGIGQSARMTMSNTLTQAYTSDDYRGRVMGVYDMEMSFVGPSVYIAGLMTEAVGPQQALGTLAALLIFVCLATVVFIPTLRRLD
ncbi:MAG: MFS transporter [Chloroflexi bacterium]|nr:MFS transporter [Chloroflexota bacterium]